MYEVEQFPATPWRRRLLVVALALGTAYMVMSHVMGRPGGADFKPPPPPDKPRCTAGQTSGCVGGMATVIIEAPVSRPAGAAASSAGG